MLIIKQNAIIECLNEIKSKQPLMWYNESIHDLFGKISALYLELRFSFDDSNKIYNILSNIIYVSTQTACSSNNPVSKAVLAVTKNKNYASSSIRISLSYLTTKEEIDMFIKVLNNKIKELS